MFFNKIFHFVKGYVIINVSGLGIERFLYICAKRKITLFEIGKREREGVVVRVSISDFKKIRPAVKKAAVNIRIIKRCGLPFYIKKLKKRYVLIVGISLFTILLFVSSLFVWSLEINSNGGKVPDDLLAAVEKSGVKIGAFKPMLQDGDDIKNIILDNTDTIVWAWVYIKGTKAVVEYREGVAVPDRVDKTVPCDIIARRDGLIDEVIEKNGTALIKAGDTVLAGDVLIAGVSSSGGENVTPVHAIGSVRAHTWHEKSRDYSLIKTLKKPTGRQKSYYTVKLFSKCINLFSSESVDFENYVINETSHELCWGRENYLGIGIYKKDYIEVCEEESTVLYEQILEYAKNELEAEIAKNLLPGSLLVDKKVTDEKIDENTVRVTVMMEFTENIGEERSSTQS